MSELTLIEAINLSLHRAMQIHPEMIVLGEDVGINGGVFRATNGLQQAFGRQRVLDTPLAESLIAGISVGMATQGLRPVAEIQFMGFIYAALEHLISHAARMRNRTRGRLTCPMTLRVPHGGGIHAPEHHSESTEAMLTHIPGLKIICPSSPRLAYQMMLAAIADPDPVIVLEPERLYRAQRQFCPDDGMTLPLECCLIRRLGQDISLISWGACVMDCLEAAARLSQEGIEAEVIDVATLKPLDRETLIASVSATGRALIVHEAARSGGLGAEIAAMLSEELFGELLSPVTRLTGYDTIMPYARMESQYLPSVEGIMNQVHYLLD
ncbi:MAG: alpha-ketoacid dehydrogenase subunit beta [Pseudomonadales bacterium]|nr:alpha-ketoacid dehydrogenase subunit beta [Pseudomonadales bacterium]